MSSSSTDGIASAAVGILVFSLFGALALGILAGAVVFGAIVGGAAGLGVTGFQIYKKRKKVGPWDERADATGYGLFGEGGVFLGEEVKWQ